VHGQSAKADFANFQRRIPSLIWRLGAGAMALAGSRLQRRHAAAVHVDGVRQELSAQADITVSLPRFQSPGLDGGFFDHG
jgi:hypothetical protein